MPIKNVEILEDPSGALVLNAAKNKVQARVGLAAGTYTTKLRVTDSDDWTTVVQGSFVVAPPA